MTQLQFEALSLDQQLYQWLLKVDPATTISQLQFESLSHDIQLYYIYEALGGAQSQQFFERMTLGQQLWKIYAIVEIAPVPQRSFEKFDLGLQLYHIHYADGAAVLNQFQFLSLTRGQQLWYVSGISASVEGWYVDSVAGSDLNTGASPAQAFETFDALAAFAPEDFDLPVFVKSGATFVEAAVIRLTTEAAPGDDIGASQTITRASGSTCVWIMGDGRVLTTDSINSGDGFDYAGVGEKVIHLIFPSGKAGVTGVGLVDGKYVPGTGMPSFAGFTDLTALDLSLNNFGGTIPDLVDMPALVTCLLDRTGTTGAMGLVNLPALEEIWLWQNTLSGTLPSFAGSTALRIVRIETNDFSGTLPSFAACTALEQFIAYDNAFTGTLPSFNTCTALEVFNIADSPGLTGTLPTFAACVALTTFDVNGCDFTAVTSGAFNGCILCSSMDFSFQINSLDPPQLNVILASCVVRDGQPGSVNATLNIRQGSGSVSGQGLTDKATLESSGWTVLNF